MLWCEETAVLMSKTSNVLCCRDTVSTVYVKYKNGLYWLKSVLGQKSVIYKYILFNYEMCLFRNVNQWFARSVYWTDTVYESRKQILIIWSWPQLMSAELRRRVDHSTSIPLMWPLSSRPGWILRQKGKMRARDVWYDSDLTHSQRECCLTASANETINKLSTLLATIQKHRTGLCIYWSFFLV